MLILLKGMLSFKESSFIAHPKMVAISYSLSVSISFKRCGSDCPKVTFEKLLAHPLGKMEARKAIFLFFFDRVLTVEHRHMRAHDERSFSIPPGGGALHSGCLQPPGSGG